MNGEPRAGLRDPKKDPFIQRALGPRAEVLEPVRIAPIRLGGEPRSTARQFMAVGDAAGQTDPLTGEGIHTGMLKPSLALPMGLEVLRQILKQKVLRSSPRGENSYTMRAREDTPRSTAFQHGGLLDHSV